MKDIILKRSNALRRGSTLGDKGGSEGNAQTNSSGSGGSLSEPDREPSMSTRTPSTGSSSRHGFRWRRVAPSSNASRSVSRSPNDSREGIADVPAERDAGSSSNDVKPLRNNSLSSVEDDGERRLSEIFSLDPPSDEDARRINGRYALWDQQGFWYRFEGSSRVRWKSKEGGEPHEGAWEPIQEKPPARTPTGTSPSSTGKIVEYAEDSAWDFAAELRTDKAMEKTILASSVTSSGALASPVDGVPPGSSYGRDTVAEASAVLQAHSLAQADGSIPASASRSSTGSSSSEVEVSAKGGINPGRAVSSGGSKKPALHPLQVADAISPSQLKQAQLVRPSRLILFDCMDINNHFIVLVD